MPYITKEDKQQEIIDNVELWDVCTQIGRHLDHPGKLNYTISKIISEYLGNAPRYADYNEVIGVLEAAKLEIYRMWVAPYEEQKRFENGDVDEV